MDLAEDLVDPVGLVAAGHVVGLEVMILDHPVVVESSYQDEVSIGHHSPQPTLIFSVDLAPQSLLFVLAV